ncbi:CLIP domain-containing serine protease 2-like [Chelonus insularis]|uniref:CLIP domain-containing serine protease 2-like n=1 Tax=Chelonus insularis TaxID=460826 RepID=UPI00158AB1FA|nr:CLIP domain-containing serine protease 2-like [Chelonus insularis]
MKMFKQLFCFTTFCFSQVFFPFNYVNAQERYVERCWTRNNEVGECINIRQCPPMLQLLQTQPLTRLVFDKLREAQCGFEGRDPKVCCVQTSIDPTPATPTEPTEWNNQETNINSRSNLLPEVCGRDLSLRIVGGERADLDEFPWMALLEYQKPNGRSTACGGVLISHRYVLTAAHCIKGKDLPKTWRLVSVRLGEYDTSTDNDCISDGRGSQVCAPPPIAVGVEEQIAHEDYNPTSRDQKNDIALLRLSQDVSFTDFIKPICLPNDENVPQRVWVAGWGKTESRSDSDVKLKLALPISDRQACLERYGSASVFLGDSQLCAGGQRGKDSCRGDSGGPLMAVESTRDGFKRWTTVGVVSFGPSPCGMQGWPGIYTKISKYTDWILQNMRP